MSRIILYIVFQIKKMEAIAKFIERIRFVDNRIQMLICDYIKRVDSSSPQFQIYYLKIKC